MLILVKANRTAANFLAAKLVLNMYHENLCNKKKYNFNFFFFFQCFRGSGRNKKKMEGIEKGVNDVKGRMERTEGEMRDITKVLKQAEKSRKEDVKDRKKDTESVKQDLKDVKKYMKDSKEVNEITKSHVKDIKEIVENLEKSIKGSEGNECCTIKGKENIVRRKLTNPEATAIGVLHIAGFCFTLNVSMNRDAKRGLKKVHILWSQNNVLF